MDFGCDGIAHHDSRAVGYGDKYSCFEMRNTQGGAKLLTGRIVSALTAQELTDVVIGMESTSVCGETLVYALREDGGHV